LDFINQSLFLLKTKQNKSYIIKNNITSLKKCFLFQHIIPLYLFQEKKKKKREKREREKQHKLPINLLNFESHQHKSSSYLIVLN
jgi:hypothetical protein